MLHFTFGEPAAFHLTLQELTTLEDPKYLFVFERRVPGRTVAFVAAPDSSTDRSDAFVIDVVTLFEGAETGQYTYHVYEQESEDNLDPDLATGEVEHGVMQLHPEVNFAYITRQSQTIFKSR